MTGWEAGSPRVAGKGNYEYVSYYCRVPAWLTNVPGDH